MSRCAPPATTSVDGHAVKTGNGFPSAKVLQTPPACSSGRNTPPLFRLDSHVVPAEPICSNGADVIRQGPLWPYPSLCSAIQHNMLSGIGLLCAHPQTLNRKHSP